MGCEIPPVAANHGFEWRILRIGTPMDASVGTLPDMTSRDDRDTFSALLQQHRGIVFKVAASYAWQAEDRDDLAQEITTHLWLAWPKYDPARRFSTWMYRVALNVAISHVRLQSVRRQHAMASIDQDLHDIADPDTDTHEHAQQLHLLQQFIHRQPALDRALLLLYLDERLQREIADILGITEANVSTRIGRLKQRLRTEL